MYLTLNPTIGKPRTLPSQQKYNGAFFLISKKIKLGVIGICKLSSYTHTQNPSDKCDSDEIWESTKREEKEPYVFIESLIEKTLCDSIEKVPTYLITRLQLCCSVCDPANLFFTSKFSFLFIWQPHHKTETGTAKLVKYQTTWTYHYDGPIRNTHHQSNLFITLFSADPGTFCAIDQPPRTLCNYVEPKLFSWSKPSIFWEFSPLEKLLHNVMEEHTHMWPTWYK